LAGRTSSWISIRAKGPLSRKDEAGALLLAAGSSAVVEARLSAASPPAGTPLADPLREAQLEAAVPASRREALQGLRERLRGLGWTFETSLAEDRDWSVAWRAGLRPVRIACPGGRGKGLLVRASWSKARPRTSEAEVVIDPSMAFGTGTHPTTKMCLRAITWLLGSKDGPLVKGAMLDMGTGTGILMIGALKLGIASALGIDTDPVALKVARKNLALNNVRARLSARPLAAKGRAFSLITANIFSEALKDLAPALVARLGPRPCFVILSGMLREQARGVEEVYRDLGLRVVKRPVSGEWASLVLRGK